MCWDMGFRITFDELFEELFSIVESLFELFFFKVSLLDLIIIKNGLKIIFLIILPTHAYLY